MRHLLAHNNAIWPWQFDADLVLGTQIDFVVVLYNTLKSETPFIQEKKRKEEKTTKNQRHCFGCKINKKRSRGNFVLLVILWGTNGMIVRMEKLGVTQNEKAEIDLSKGRITWIALSLCQLPSIDWEAVEST